MPHDVSLIALLAAGFALAMVFGYLASLLKMPPLVGYLLAGIVIGPGTPGFVGDLALAQQLAEIGVMLLMFGVGLHFSLGDLLAVRKIALPGAIVQIAVATALGGGLTLAWGWSIGAALVFGLALSVASTVVLLRALEGRGLVETVNGRIAVGWLVVEDLVMVLVLVLLPPLAGLLGGAPEAPAGAAGHAAEAGGSLWSTLAITFLKVAAFIALMLVVGKRVFPRILWLVARTGSRELFTLCMIAAAVGVAFGAAKLFDVSFALGAFFAGMMMRESEFARRAAEDTLPLRDAFSVLFFISVGMLFDPTILVEQPLHVIEVALIVVIGKTLAAVALVLAFRYPLNTALTVGAGLAQIGEAWQGDDLPVELGDSGLGFVSRGARLFVLLTGAGALAVQVGEFAGSGIDALALILQGIEALLEGSKFCVMRAGFVKGVGGGAEFGQRLAKSGEAGAGGEQQLAEVAFALQDCFAAFFQCVVIERKHGAVGGRTVDAAELRAEEKFADRPAFAVEQVFLDPDQLMPVAGPFERGTDAHCRVLVLELVGGFLFDAEQQVEKGGEGGGFASFVRAVDDVQVGGAGAKIAKIDGLGGELAVARQVEAVQAHQAGSSAACACSRASTSSAPSVTRVATACSKASSSAPRKLRLSRGN